jgi:hypothetical protein
MSSLNLRSPSMGGPFPGAPCRLPPSTSLVRTSKLGQDEGVPGPQDTIARGIFQAVTPNSIPALRAIRASRGTAVAVTDEQMPRSIPPPGAEGRHSRRADRGGGAGGVEEDASGGRDE